jgi:FMN phosphatase YigB (HAD superfamily)
MTIRNVLLDAGGVILDETTQEKALADLVVSLILSYNPTYSLQQYQLDVDDAVMRFVPRVYPYILFKNIGNREDYPEIYARYSADAPRLRPPFQIMPGMEIQLPKLAENYRLAIAGQYGRELLDTLKQHKLLDCFAVHLTQDDYAITKPDPRYYEQILARCQMKPDETVMVGDRIDNDVIPARQVGMKSIRIRLGLHRNQEARYPEEIPDIEISSADQLFDAVSSLG